MINLTYPDKWIRKALYDALNGQTVDGDTIPVFDQRVTTDAEPEKYILLRAQGNQSNEVSHCGYEWDHSITLEVFTRTADTGRRGSRVAVDNIVDNSLQLLQGLQLDPASNLNIHRINISAPGDFYDIDNGYVVATKTLLIQFRIN